MSFSFERCRAFSNLLVESLLYYVYTVLGAKNAFKKRSSFLDGFKHNDDDDVCILNKAFQPLAARSDFIV